MKGHARPEKGAGREVWRIALRSEEPAEVLEAIRTEAQRLGAKGIEGWVYERAQRGVERIEFESASGAKGGRERILTAHEARAVERWMKEARGGERLPEALAEDAAEWGIEMGFVAGEGEGCAVIVGVSGVAGAEAKKDIEGLIEDAGEPVWLSVRNARRIQELRKQQAAAEAEKQALLSRLGKQETGDEIVGAQTGLMQVMERVRQVAHSDVPVLIFGETGSGKELIARAVHTGSQRAEGPFIRVNCGAIAPELMDSELFGHERGSFTGASAMRRGWFERANEGTLFLDEIGELPSAAQVRLLRILQDGTFTRVGGSTQLTADVRVVAATHRDLPAMIEEGRFREDLWYRLAVFPIRLPSLRERVEDIGAMAEHFATRSAKKFGFHVCLPTESDLELLRGYEWPGNVRELASVIDRAAILGEGRTLEIATALGSWGRKANTKVVEKNEGRRGGDGDSLEEATRKHIEDALRECKGRVDGPFGAARVLKINANTLRSKMRRLGVDAKRFKTGS